MRCIRLTGHRQRNQDTLLAHGFSGIAEGLHLPTTGMARTNVLGPAAKSLQSRVGQLQQRRLHWFLLGQPGIDHLLHRPSRLAKVVQADHARAAFERVECPAQRRLFAQIPRFGDQCPDSSQSIGHHFTCFFEEDVQQFVLDLVDDHRYRQRQRRHFYQWHVRRKDILCCRRIAFQCSIQLQRHTRCDLKGHCCVESRRIRSVANHLCTCEWRGHWCRLDRGIQRCARHQIRHRYRIAIFDLLCHCLLVFLGIGNAGTGTPHQDAQFTQFLVIDKQLARHGALVAEHVDQEAQSTQTVAQFFEYLLAFDIRRNIVGKQTLHCIAHAQDGQRRLIQPQHREHTPHLCQSPRNSGEWRNILWIPEKLIHGPFGLAQRGAQLTDHAAHGLVVTDTPVKLFHPGFQRLRCAPGTDTVEAARQTPGACHHLLFSRVRFFQRGLQIQHCRGHFHSQGRRRGLSRTRRRIQRLCQCLRQALTVAVELAQGIAHQAELIRRGLELVAITTGQRRPGFGSRRNTLSRLSQNRRIKSAETPRFIVHWRIAIQPESCAHGTQTGHFFSVRGLCLGTEKQQILHQSVRNARITPCQRGVLHENARSNPLGVHVRGKQPPAERLKETGAYLPERTCLAVGLPGHKTERNIAQLPCGIEISVFDNFQYRLIKSATHWRTIVQRLRRDLDLRLAKAPLHRPKVCGMDALSPRQCLNVAVLGKEGHGRYGLARQHTLQVLAERETGALQCASRVVGAQFWALHELLHCRFHGAQNQRRRGHADHLQGTAGLVQLLARYAQCGNIQRRQVGLPCQVGIVHEAPQRLDGTVQGLAQLL